MADWKFGRRQRLCSECERVFLDSEPHHSLLSLSGTEFGRVDLCASCFARRDVAADVVWWRTRYTEMERKGVQLDLDSIHALFGTLEGKPERGWRELRYLLCLILMRKRRLKVVGVKRIDGDEVFVVRRPRSEEERIVHVFDFSSERRAVLREVLQAIFEGADVQELDPDGAPPSSPAPSEGAEGEGSEASESESGAADVDPVGIA